VSRESSAQWQVKSTAAPPLHSGLTSEKRLSSLGLRHVPRWLLYLPGLAGHRGLGRAFDIDAALIEPERWIPVCHQGHINQQPVAPPIDSNRKIKKARGITGREQHGESCDQHTRQSSWGWNS